MWSDILLHISQCYLSESYILPQLLRREVRVRVWATPKWSQICLLVDSGVARRASRRRGRPRGGGEGQEEGARGGQAQDEGGHRAGRAPGRAQGGGQAGPAAGGTGDDKNGKQLEKNKWTLVISSMSVIFQCSSTYWSWVQTGVPSTFYGMPSIPPLLLHSICHSIPSLHSNKWRAHNYPPALPSIWTVIYLLSEVYGTQIFKSISINDFFVRYQHQKLHQGRMSLINLDNFNAIMVH